MGKYSASKESTIEFEHHRQYEHVLLTAEDSKAVLFHVNGISVKDYQCLVTPTWVDIFFRKDQNDGPNLVTFTQKLKNKFVILKNDSNKLTVSTFDMEDTHNESKPNVQKLLGSDLKQHLYIMKTQPNGSKKLQCYEENSVERHLCVKKNRVIYEEARCSESSFLFQISEYQEVCLQRRPKENHTPQ